MRVVIDTNVFVSGLLTPTGPCGEIMRLMVAGAFTPCYSPHTLAEYREVLGRERFRFDPARVAAVLDSVRHGGVLAPARVSCPDLPHEDDRPFLEAALGAGAHCIVTGNTAHFPSSVCRPVSIVGPVAFLKLIVAAPDCP